MKGLRGSLLVFALFGLAGWSRACLNDFELRAREREFRSQYALFGAVSGSERPRPEPDHNGLLLGAGATLLLAAFGLAADRDRAEASSERAAPDRTGEAFVPEERRDPVEV